MTATLPFAEVRHRLLGTDVHLLVADPAVLTEAERVLVDLLQVVDLAASRFRPDSELARLPQGRTRISPLLAELVTAALAVARATDGLVDPTLGAQLCDLGYDRTLAALPPDRPATVRVHRPGRWRDVVLEHDVLEVPPGVRLDLGATAKAWAADAAAARIAALGTSVLVNLGGDLAVAGPAPEGGWPVAVADRPGAEPVQTVVIRTGALATSSTTARTWRVAGVPVHHVLDPRTGAPAASDWAAVSVVADTCLEANSMSTAAIVLGAAAPAWLAERAAPALLQSRSGALLRLGGWP